MQKKTKKLDQKIQQITLVYKQLQKTDIYVAKKGSIDTLRKLCTQALGILDMELITSENIRKRKQVEDMLKRCVDIEKKIDTNEESNPSIGLSHEGVNNYRAAFRTLTKREKLQEEEGFPKVETMMDQQELRQKSRQVAKSMIFHEMASQHMKITTEELDELAKRIEKNNEVMKQIQLMVIEQGGNINEIQHNLSQVYDNVEGANVELDKAAQLVKRNRILKIRLGLSGFFGALGLKILGLPGLIFGFFGGMVATS